MKIAFIVAGKMKSKPLSDLFEEYRKRIGAYVKIEIETVKSAQPDRHPSADGAALEETDRLLAKLEPRDWVVALDERGEAMRSERLAESLRSWMDRGPGRIAFVIGGPNGLGPKLKERADVRLALSKMTLPHEVAIVVAAEQVYRALTILHGHPYHNGEAVK